VKLVVYNSLGEEQTTLINGMIESGFHSVVFDAKGLPSGVYFVRMVAGNYISTKKMVLLR
jgi:hypothetical protein